MNDTNTRESAALTTTGIAGVIAGGGVVTFALFPFAIPFLLLTAVFAAPLVLLAVVPALAVGLVVTVVLAIRAIGRRLGRRHGGRDPLEPVRDRARGAGDAREILAHGTSSAARSAQRGAALSGGPRARASTDGATQPSSRVVSPKTRSQSKGGGGQTRGRAGRVGR